MAQVENRTMPLAQIVREVRSGVLRVPRFQRDFVWRHDQVLELFESIRLRYPIGSLLIWRTGERFRSFDSVGPIPVPPDQPKVPALVGYVLDGHQRLTALFGALALDQKSADRLHGSNRVFLVYFDLDYGKFTHARVMAENLLPLRVLLSDGDELTAWIDHRRDQTTPGSPARALWDVRRRQALNLQTTFAQYTVPYLDVTGATLSEAVDIFVRLNTQGTRAGRREVMNALTWEEGGFDFMESAREILKDAPAYDNFGVEPILRAVLAALGENIYADLERELLGRHKSRLESAMNDVRVAFSLATDFLAREVGASSGKVVPYALQLVLLSEFFRLCPRPSPEATRALIKWFWASSFSAAYSLGGSLSFNDAIVRAGRLARSEPVDLLDTKPVMRPFPRTFHPKSARVRAFHLFLKTLEPRSLVDGRTLPRDSLLARGMADARTVAHEGKNGWRLASRLLIGSGRMNPVDDLRALRSSLFWSEDVIASHLIPARALDALLAGDEDTFLREREVALTDAERKFASQYVSMPQDPGELIEDEPEVDVEEPEASDIA